MQCQVLRKCDIYLLDILNLLVIASVLLLDMDSVANNDLVHHTDLPWLSSGTF